MTNNAFVDGPRTILLHLSDPQNAQLGAQDTAVLTIQDDDGGGTLSFSATGYAYPDKLGYATITVTRSGGSAGGVSVKFRTGTAGTAVARNGLHRDQSPQTLTSDRTRPARLHRPRLGRTRWRRLQQDRAAPPE